MTKVSKLSNRINAIKDTIRAEYRKEHDHPWLVAYSGGKDSTLLLQLVWEVVAGLAPEARERRVIVVGNDTLVELPPRHRPSPGIAGRHQGSRRAPAASDRDADHGALHRPDVLGQRHRTRLHPARAELPLVYRPHEDLAHHSAD